MNCQHTPEEAIRATQLVWPRERLTFGEWSPGKCLRSSLRDHQRWQLAGAWAAGRHVFSSAMAETGIPLIRPIGGGLRLPHPHGVVIHPRVCVVPHCLNFQQLTLGVLATADEPLGDGHADIDANAFVLSNVPARHTAVGIPTCGHPAKWSPA
jgi:serine O-acetyltransferase